MHDLTAKYVGKVKGVNPNLSFIEHEINRYRILTLPGGTRCFHADTPVITTEGDKKISEVKTGDLVLSNEGFKPVTATHEMNNTKPTVKVRLKNGQHIICTEDHEFFYRGAWVSIKHILSLWDEANPKL